MAYMKTGRVREVQKRTKVAIAVVLAVLLLVLALVLFAVKNPRSALQMVLSDQDYASTVMLRNAKAKGTQYRPFLDRLTENTAYDSVGGVEVELSADMEALVGSSEALETAQRYFETLSFTGNTQVRGLNFSNELKLNDNQKTIFTHDLAYLAGGAFSNVPEYGYGWTQVLGTENKMSDAEKRQQRVIQTALSTDDETVRKALTKAAKAGYKAVKKDVDVTIDKDKTLDFQDKHATGERVNILLDRSDAQGFLKVFFEKLEKSGGLKDAVNELLDTDDRFASEETFQQFLEGLKEEYLHAFRDTGISNVSVDLLVDKKNVIHAFDALVKRPEGDIIVNAMLQDDENRGPAFHLRVNGDTIVKFNVEKSSKTAGRVDFALGNFENAFEYSNLSTGDGLVFGTFQFDPAKVTWSEDLGSFGLFLQTSPGGTTDGKTGFHILAQTGFSTLGTATINADVTDAEYTGMVTEEDMEMATVADDIKKARRIQYWLVDLPEADGQYNMALREIVQTVINDVMTIASASATTTDDNTLSTGATKPVN